VKLVELTGTRKVNIKDKVNELERSIKNRNIGELHRSINEFKNYQHRTNLIKSENGSPLTVSDSSQFVWPESYGLQVWSVSIPLLQSRSEGGTVMCCFWPQLSLLASLICWVDGDLVWPCVFHHFHSCATCISSRWSFFETELYEVQQM
jgi:hypothetical protein